MRKAICAVVVLTGMALGARLVSAQMVDPSTGITVDASTDPMDFSAIMSGQPTNVGMEVALSAAAQAQQAAEDNLAAMQSASDEAMNAPSTSNDNAPAVAPRPALPTTAKPMITPGGGTFTGSVQVSIADSDGAAAVFYTLNGKKPTVSSTRYQGPIMVSAKTKVQALAFDVSMQPSGVVSKTFKVRTEK